MQIQLLERRMMSKSISISAKFQSKTFNKKPIKMIDKQANINIKCWTNKTNKLKKIQQTNRFNEKNMQTMAANK